MSREERLTIYAGMKKTGVKHYIVSCCTIGIDGKRARITDTGFIKNHTTDESFEKEISFLQGEGYNFFDVIHMK